MTAPLVQLQDVTVTLAGRDVLSGVTWALHAGSVWAVTGANGAGKSTFFRLVRGDAWPSRGTRTYALGGRVTNSPLRAKERVALVSPELGDWYVRHDWALTASQVIQSGFAGAYLPPYPALPEHETAAAAVAGRVGVENLLDRDVRTLSQGQRRRVLLARALVTRPDVLILDEFWEGVDASSHRRLRALVEGLARDGVTVLYSTHRPEEFLAGTTGHLHLAGGGVHVREATRSGVPSHSRPVTRGIEAGPVLIRIEDADVYREGQRVLHGASWTLREGEHWAFLGANGAGKSTLARLVAGEVHPAYGATVERFGLGPLGTLDERRRLIGLVSADVQAQHRAATALRPVSGAVVVASGFTGSVGYAEHLTDEQRGRMAGVVARLGVEDLLERDVSGLSHGELKKLLFARAFVRMPRLLVLDEPFDYLDTDFRARLRADLDAAAAGGTQVLVVAHHPSDVPTFVTHAALIDGGRVVQHGPFEEVAARAWNAPPRQPD